MRGLLAGLMVTAMALAAMPAIAQADVAPTSVVAGDAMTSTFRTNAAGTSREATLPGLAALQLATTPQQARDAVTAHLRSLAGRAAAQANLGALEDAWVVGDLSGDRRKDVVVVHHRGGQLTYAATEGDTGKALWSLPVAAGPVHYGVALPLKGKGSAGALLITTTYEEVPSEVAWTVLVTTTVTAVGVDGAQRWTRRMDGTISYTEAGVVGAGLGYPLAIGPLNGPGDDVAIRTDEAGYSLAAVGTSRIEVLDGATGTVGAVVEAASEGDVPASNVVGDLDGDGLGDIVTVSNLGGQILTVAHSAVTGQPLWRTTAEGDPVLWVDSAGRADADEIADLLLVRIDWEGGNFFAFAVASGADGAALWHKTSEGLVPAGDISGDGRDDLLLLDDVYNDSVLGLRYMGFTGTGKKVYSRDYGVTPPKGSFMAITSVGDAGDVDGDGSLDLQHEIFVSGFSSGSSAQDSGTVLTKNGRKVNEGVRGGSLYASVDGRGDDMVWMRPQGDTLLVIVRDGLTGAELWRKNVPSGGDLRWGFGFGADLTRDGAAEVIVLAYKAKAGMVLRVLDGRKATLRWSR